MRKLFRSFLITSVAVIATVGLGYATALPAVAVTSAPVHNAQTQALAAHSLTPAPVQGVHVGRSDLPDTFNVGPYHICMWDNNNSCLEGQGPGKQVITTTNSSDYSNWWTNVNVCGYPSGVCEWQDGNGNCLREGTSNDVKLENGGCNSGDDTDLWIETNLNNGYTTYQNDAYGDYMGTFGTNNDRPVWAEAKHSGFYVGWIELS